MFFFFAKLNPFWDRTADGDYYSRLIGKDGKFSGYLIMKIDTRLQQWFDCWFDGAAYRLSYLRK